MTRHPVAGSEQAQPTGARCIGQCNPDERIEVIVMLRRKDEAAFRDLMREIEAGKAPAVPVSREAFAGRFGASQADIETTSRFADQNNLEVVRADPATRSVVLRGTIAQFERAFGVTLELYEHPGIGSYRGRAGPIHVPDDMHGVVQAVLGLDTRPLARPHFRIRPPFRPAIEAQAAAFTPVDLARIYDFPAGDGSGQCIGLIELGGGYSTSDLTQYFSSLGLATPNFVAVSVDQATNSPTGDPNGADGEVTLDIEVAGAVAPGATIAVYFTPNSDSGFIDAVNQAIHDTTNRPSVLSISWGSSESNWTSQSINAFNEVLQSAATLGVTVCVASGDSGSSNGSADGSNQVDFPASSPFVLACGGTHLTTSGSTGGSASGSTIASETVWNDGSQGGASGGGISAVFALPAWQQGLSATLTQGNQAESLNQRGVPDVAADASPETGYEVLVDGQTSVIGGTSAVAPLWAGLIARINAANGSASGFINPKLYAAATIGNDITVGNNGTYEASPGWDACTGLGSPDGKQVATAISST